MTARCFRIVAALAVYRRSTHYQERGQSEQQAHAHDIRGGGQEDARCRRRVGTETFERERDERS